MHNILTSNQHVFTFQDRIASAQNGMYGQVPLLYIAPLRTSQASVNTYNKKVRNMPNLAELRNSVLFSYTTNRGSSLIEILIPISTSSQEPKLLRLGVLKASQL